MKTYVIFLLVVMLSLHGRADDESNFSAAPPATWTRFNPLSTATFGFGAGTARLSSAAPSAVTFNIFGPARLALFAPTTFTQTVVSADLVAWAGSRDVPAVIARAGNIGLGTVRGYSFGFIPATGLAAIHRVTGEVPTAISPVGTVAVTVGHSYRVVLVCAGSVLTGRVYDVANLANPMVELRATDSTYPAGVTGILNSAETAIAIDASFDNFLAWDGSQPPLSVVRGPGNMTIRADAKRSVCADLEASDNLNAPWAKVLPNASINGAWLENVVSTVVGPRFYRRKLVGLP
jgi:hypothetical protein